jgi:ribosomal peptide maturation radical SAM protein 1
MRMLFPSEGLSLDSARLLVIVPPFASPDRPSIGAHIVAQVAEDSGYAAEILYANLSFAALVGTADYSRLCHTPTGHLLGERIFARAYYGHAASPVLTEEAAEALRQAMRVSGLDLAVLQRAAESWAEFYARRLAGLAAEIIGFTSTFEQTLASLALIRRIKQLAPDKRLILGGANVDGPMADAVAALWPEIDHVFSGESEASVRDFLGSLAAGEEPPRICRGTVNNALDALPPPDYASYAAQLAQTISSERVDDGLRPQDIWLPYESSRGCWWGAKHHCTFCGLNALGMGYRAKHPAKVAAELAMLARSQSGARIMMVDNIMPFSYFSTLLPQLAHGPPLDIFYEQKANLSFEKMKLLAEAGVNRIQPGIESLDSGVLALMRKGTNLRTNLRCLRYARAMKIDLAWNLIVDFPHEQDAAYEGMLALIPHIVHLQPPGGISALSIERFSPYFDESEAFGISNLRPIDAYGEAHPGLSDAAGIAYHFRGDYDSAFRRRPDLARRIHAAVEAWETAWSGDGPVPLLEIFELSEDRFLICDTRPGAVCEAELIGREEARMCLTGVGSPELSEWALARRYVWSEGEQALPLAVAAADCLAQFVAPPAEAGRASALSTAA